MIEINDLFFDIGNRKILKNINLKIEDKKNFVLIGPSGSGKSTIIRNIIGLSKPTKGQILVDGIDINKINKKNLSNIRKQFGFLFQHSALFDSMTIEENLMFPVLNSHIKLTEKELKNLVDKKLELVGMSGINNLYPSELSGGMKKRAALARAIILEPKYILYDEPTTGLDPIMSNIVSDIIKDLSQKLDITSLVVSHDMKLALKIADKLALIHNGEIKLIGTVEDIKKSDNKFFKQFVSGNVDGPIKLKITEN